MKRIVHVTNFKAREAVNDGGGSREKALASFFAANGAERVVVQDSRYWQSKGERLFRSQRLLREIDGLKPDLVVLDYPSYPFFWQYRVTRYFMESLLFAERLRRLGSKRGFKILIDVMDIPVFQYKDLGFSLDMSPRAMMFFDRFIFSRADMLWVCSESLVELIGREYGVPASRMLPVLNGYSQRAVQHIRSDSRMVRFVYAGSLNRERGIEPVLEAFVNSGQENVEIHLCGCGGDWIRERFSDPHVVYHGELSNEEAGELVSSCDVGLIPYPERGYYNLAFATKLAFYLGHGLPVLCSNASETAGHVKRLGVGVCRPISEFGKAMADIADNPESILQWRERVVEVREGFSWESIYSRAFEETCSRFNSEAAVGAGCR